MNIQRKYIVSADNDIMNGDNIAIINSGEYVVVLEKFELELMNMLNGELTIKDISSKLSNKYGKTYVAQDFYEFIEMLLNLGIINEVNTDE